MRTSEPAAAHITFRGSLKCFCAVRWHPIVAPHILASVSNSQPNMFLAHDTRHLAAESDRQGLPFHGRRHANPYWSALPPVFAQIEADFSWSSRLEPFGRDELDPTVWASRAIMQPVVSPHVFESASHSQPTVALLHCAAHSLGFFDCHGLPFQGRRHANPFTSARPSADAHDVSPNCVIAQPVVMPHVFPTASNSQPLTPREHWRSHSSAELDFHVVPDHGRSHLKPLTSFLPFAAAHEVAPSAFIWQPSVTPHVIRTESHWQPDVPRAH